MSLAVADLLVYPLLAVSTIGSGSQYTGLTSLEASLYLISHYHHEACV